MFESLSMPFIQRALLAGILTGFLGSYYGVFIVQRKMSFMGDGLAHAAFGGIALGLLLGAEPLWIAIPFTVLVSLAISYVKNKTRLEIDTTIGIFFSISVALGIIFLSMRKEYTVDAFSYLFGSVLFVFPVDLWIASGLALVSILTIFIYWSRWAYSTFDAELARTERLKVEGDDYVLSVLISLSIVVSIKLVGIILMAAFLVIPAASAKTVSRSFIGMTLLSVCIGIASSIAGLLISLMTDTPSGATIILVQAVFFFVLLISGKLRY